MEWKNTKRSLAEAANRNEPPRRHARPKSPPMTIHALSPLNQSAFSQSVDSALFAGRTQSMMGNQWPEQTTDTLADWARGRGWFWLTCRVCSHRVATPVVPLAILLGLRYPMARLREKAWCTMCGCFGAHSFVPGWVDAQVQGEAFPPERGYAQHFATLEAQGQLRYAIGARGSNTPVREQLTLAQAAFGALLASGFTFRVTQSWRTLGVRVFSQGERIAEFEGQVIPRGQESTWCDVHTAIARDLMLMERHYVIDAGPVPLPLR
jgi:hypothetical protein